MHSATDSPSLWRDIRDAIRGAEHDYTEGAIGRAIFLLAVPMVIEMSMESIFAVVDVFFVGRLGPAAVATVGLTESLMVILYTVAMGLSIGATATVARRVGEKDADGAARATVQALLLGLALSSVLGILGAVFAPELLALMGADADVLAVGTGYARVSLGCNGAVFLLFLVNAAFRGAGDPAIAMRVLVLGNAINIALDPLLIFGVGFFPELGLVGAAWATVIGRLIGFLWALWHLSVGDGNLHVHRRHVVVEPSTMYNIATLSGWGTFQVALSSMSWIALVRITAMFGATAMAGYTIAIRILLFALMPAYGVGAAAATMVGQALGADKPDRAERSVWTAARINVVVLTLTGIAFLIFAPGIVSLFTEAEDVRAVGTYGLRAMSLGFPLYALGMILEQSFNGAGDTKTPSWINFFVFWVLQLPLAWWMAQRTGLEWRGVFIAVPVAYSALAVVSALLFRQGRWKTKVV
ncbi:MAG: MATE family efflux transporter [Gemmatimonadaceae bacterium]|nr:MATE family efflux transporter [Gemmatimonadaceae bacterium]MCW5826188.1 MATE family efflux transporter [Gemmatimonadaceae bacterium]